MGFFKEIADSLIKDNSLRELSVKQCEAIIDAMTLVAYADGEETFLERQELEHLLHELPWTLRDAGTVDAYRAASAERMEAVVGRGESEVRMAASDIGFRLETLEAKKQAYKMAIAVAYADWDADHQEHKALHLLAEALEIPQPFAGAMMRDVEASSLDVVSLEETTDQEVVPAPTAKSVRDVLSTNFLRGFFTDLFNDDELLHMEEGASYAFVDALTLALVADGYPELEELREFKSQLESLPFAVEDAEHVRSRVEIVIDTLSKLDAQGRFDYMQGVSDRIPSSSLKERALAMAIGITNADLDITDEESSILLQMANAFGVSSERMQQMIERVRARDTEDFLGA